MQLMPAAKQALFIGIGNEYRQDDAAGLIVARRMKEIALQHITVIEESGDAVVLMEKWAPFDTVFICDAIFSGAQPGTIFRFDAHKTELPAIFSNCSTHDFGLLEAIELSRTLSLLPDILVVYGIEGIFFNQGQEISKEVTNSIEKTIRQVLRELQC